MKNSDGDVKQIDLFVGDICDVAPKSDLQTMEFPIFALSNKISNESIKYEFGNGNWVKLSCDKDTGRPTILDKDVLLYCIGQIAEALNRGKPASRRVAIKAYDFLISTGRHATGADYEYIEKACRRLGGLTISTQDGFFRLIDAGGFKRDSNGKLLHLEVLISEYLYDEFIKNNRILTYSQGYYGLSSPYERRMYEICRKHCGNQNYWEIGLETLFSKFGVRSGLREFRRKIKELIVKNNIPDYLLEHITAKDSGTIEKIVVYKKASLQKTII